MDQIMVFAYRDE